MMKTKYAFENLLRYPCELITSFIAFSFGLLCITRNSLLALNERAAICVSIPFFIIAILRTYQGSRILFYKKRLLTLLPFSMSTAEVPISTENLFLGKGFRWQPIHRQRMYLLSGVENQGFMQKSAIYRFVQKRAKEKPNGICVRLSKISWLPFKPMSDIGGKPWLHGMGSDHEQSVFIKQSNRNSHIVVFGMTRVGKTRFMSILVNQDIRNGEAVLVLDPKGDLEVIQDMYCACKATGRLQDFMVLHAGMPEVSAKYNPLSSYTNVSEIATRITGAIQAEGEGKQFKDFAWKFLNIVATCLEEMGEQITYKSLSFFVTRPRQMLLAYCDKVLPKKDPNYLYKVQEIMNKHNNKVDKYGKEPESITRADAARIYIAQYIESVISEGKHAELHDSIIADLHHAAELGEEYYGKITASLSPVFDKINKTTAGEVFSWEHNFGLPIINLEDTVKRKKVIYIGLDSLSNKAMSEAVGQAVIADLVSLCGRLYKEIPDKDRTFCLHADEFSEIVRDEFVTLLNKAGGAGVKVTAYTQTVNDLGVAFGTSRNKPKMLLGNFGTTVMLRIANQDTARILTECLETVQTRNTTPSTMANDRSDGKGGELFTTYNTDIVSENKEFLLVENDLFSLPKGQAFLLTNGGELYKIRMPLPKNDGSSPSTFETLLYEVNLCQK